MEQRLLETTMIGYAQRTYTLGLGVSYESLTDEEKRVVEQSKAYVEYYNAVENERVLKLALEDFERLRDIPNMPEEAIDILRDWTLRDDDDEMDYDE